MLHVKEPAAAKYLRKDSDCDYALNQQQQCELHPLTLGCISLTSGHSRLGED